MSGVDKEREEVRGAARSRGVNVAPKDNPVETASESEDAEDALNDRWFNPHRYPRSKAAQAIVEDVTGQLQVYESHFELRKRARRRVDQETFETTVAAIISDLMYHHVIGHEGGVAITRSNSILGRRSRYRPIVYGKTLPRILDLLKTPEMDFLKQEVGGGDDVFGPVRCTTILPGKRLITRIKDHGIGQEDLGLRDKQEVIILKRPKESYWDDGGFEEYEDTDLTHRYRAEMRRINDFLQDAPLDLDKSALKKGKHVDVSDRLLRRVFTRGRFDSGGRLFGGFWQSLSKGERLEGLSINGESVVCLDYGQMGLRIAYGLAKATPPADDGYHLPGLEANREAIKKLFNAVLFAEKPLTRLPKGLRPLLPEGTSLHSVMELMTQVHTPLQPLFFTGIGHRVQFIESQILVDVLLQALEADIVALPVHDAIIVAEYNAEEAEGLMREVFEAHTGVPGVVRREEPRECLFY